MNQNKYKRSPVVDLPDRQWPSKQIEKAPRWCSVDLRDGNQALIEPMVVEEKLEMFQLLVDLGFKEIEVGFPSASQLEFDFLRTLVDRNMIPEDVTVQVLVQCREHLIKRSFEALQGVKKAIIHIYNSTSVIQREVVFNMSKEQIKDIAVEGTKLVKELAKSFDGQITLEYSPESFNGTELEFALEICTAVQEIWKPTKENKIIFNLPATVESVTPNVHADQIEWMCRNFKDRDNIIVSLHTHNDRGTGVASTELALLAGADRVEGTLFGNGERTGNADILNIALNMFSQGIDINLDFSNIDKVIDVYEKCTKIQVHLRHPYAGRLVFTAFSGSHQDAINKGMKARQLKGDEVWEVPYLPIDPYDLGREYEALVRINSQSGKGGIAFIMDIYYGFKMPKAMHKEFADIIQKISEKQGEVMPAEINEQFKKEYLDINTPLKFIKAKISDDSEDDNESTIIDVKYETNGVIKNIVGKGNGPIDSLKKALQSAGFDAFKVLSYNEHALTQGSDSKAAAYIELEDEKGKKCFGVGVDNNITVASIKAVFSAVNRHHSI
ncbi:MAG: leuA [Clostridiales bacterium]|jgi:2-isopropylmalate synthase|nr:leuA [Clostridiales bacterium]